MLVDITLTKLTSIFDLKNVLINAEINMNCCRRTVYCSFTLTNVVN